MKMGIFEVLSKFKLLKLPDIFTPQRHVGSEVFCIIDESESWVP